MRTLKFKIVTGFVLLLVFLASTLTCAIDISAKENKNLHQETKIYSSNNSDYFYGCEDYADYRGIKADITVLVHGYGCSNVSWSNDISVNNGKTFIYNSASLIAKMYDELDGNMSLYIANGVDNTDGNYNDDVYDFSYTLNKYSYQDYLYGNDGHETKRIDDVSKHIVVVYNSCIPTESNTMVYRWNFTRI